MFRISQNPASLGQVSPSELFTIIRANDRPRLVGYNAQSASAIFSLSFTAKTIYHWTTNVTSLLFVFRLYSKFAVKRPLSMSAG